MWIGFQALSVSVVVVMNFLVFPICNAIYIPSERISRPDLDIFLQIRSIIWGSVVVYWQIKKINYPVMYFLKHSTLPSSLIIIFYTKFSITR